MRNDFWHLQWIHQLTGRRKVALGIMKFLTPLNDLHVFPDNSPGVWLVDVCCLSCEGGKTHCIQQRRSIDDAGREACLVVLGGRHLVEAIVEKEVRPAFQRAGVDAADIGRVDRHDAVERDV